MTADDALFDLGGPQSRPVEPLTAQPAPIREDQIAQLREAFAGSGIDDMAARRELVENCVQRPTESLRDLRSTDVRFILERLKKLAAARSGDGSTVATGSSWDQRDGDTWIDRL